MFLHVGSNFVGLTEHRQGASIMALVEKSDSARGGGQPGGRLFISGGDTLLGAIEHDDEQVESNHVGFLRHITGEWEVWQADG